jgi:hypothetical protein
VTGAAAYDEDAPAASAGEDDVEPIVINNLLMEEDG